MPTTDPMVEHSPHASGMLSDLDDEFGLIPAWPAVASLVVFLAPVAGAAWERMHSTDALAGAFWIALGIFLVWPISGFALLVTGVPVIIQRTYRMIMLIVRRRRGDSI